MRNQQSVPLAAFLVAAVAIAVGFQNCGEFKGGGENAATKTSTSDTIPVLPAVDFDFSTQPDYLPRLDRLNRVATWSPRSELEANLYPPFSTGSVRLNMDASPMFSSGKLSFAKTSTLQLSDYDLASLTSSEYSVNLVLSKMTLGDAENTTANAAVRIFDLYPAESTDQLGHLALNYERETVGAQTTFRYRLIFWFESANFAYLDFTVTKDKVAAPHIVTMVFGKSYDKLSLFIDGMETTSSTVLVGQPRELGVVPRKLGLNGLGSPATFDLHRMTVSLKGLDDTAIHQIGHILAKDAGTTYQGQATGGGGTGGTGGDTTITYAKLMGTGATAVFKNSCVACHSAASPLGNLNLESYAQASAKANAIVDRMQGIGAVMPTSGQLSADLINYVKRWRDAGAPQ